MLCFVLFFLFIKLYEVLFFGVEGPGCYVEIGEGVCKWFALLTSVFEDCFLTENIDWECWLNKIWNVNKTTQP